MSAALELLASLRLEDGRLWGDAALGFQFEDARAVLEGEQPYNFLTRPRGGSKTTDLAAVALAMIVTAEARARLYWLAADSDQGALAIDCIAGFVARTPALAGRVGVHARRVHLPDSGAALEVLPADAPGAWGLNPHAVFVDELANWHGGVSARRLWEAASSAVAKRPDARLAVLTTAGDPAHFAAKVLEHARTSPMWRVHEVPGPTPWMAPDRVAEQRSRLPRAVFEQLFLNRWTAADGAFLDPSLIAAAFTLDGPATDRSDGRSYVAGLDLGHVNDRTVFALGHREGDETHLDRLQVWQGSSSRPVDFGEVERFITASHERFRFRLRVDPWQALDLAQRLRAKGIVTDEFHFSTASKQRLASALLEGVNGGTLRLYEAEGLREELIALRVRQTIGGAWTFDHLSGGHDDRAVGLALMLVASIEQRPASWHPVFSADEEPELRAKGFALVDGRLTVLPEAEAEAEREKAEQARKDADPLSDPERWFFLT